MTAPSSIQIAGGLYEEICVRPRWHEIFGSGGRAASALAKVLPSGAVTLNCYGDAAALDVANARAALDGSHVLGAVVDRTCSFRYTHGLDRPLIDRPRQPHHAIAVRAPRILRFGMLEGSAVVHGERVVYDPQNAVDPEPFGYNGSTARELAVVLNEREAASMTGLRGGAADVLAAEVLARNSADLVVLKRGPYGALVRQGDASVEIPAYWTSSVWKLGSGDVFAAHFALRWAVERLPPVLSARLASQATALYCEGAAFPSLGAIAGNTRQEVTVSDRVRHGRRPKVYLAGPFFNLAQLWLVEQARQNLSHFGLDVFSPYHDVGYGSAADVVGPDLEGIRHADLVLALVDDLDSGTIYEVGYARALGKPVVVYCENESEGDLKMMSGSGCSICTDYVSAVYHTLWTAIGL